MRISLLIGWALLSAWRVQTFQTNLTVWESAVNVTPTFLAYMNYRNALVASGRFGEAIMLCPQLTETAKGPEAHRVLGLACLSPGR